MIRLFQWVMGCMILLFCQAAIPVFAGEESAPQTDRVVESLTLLQQGQQTFQRQIEEVLGTLGTLGKGSETIRQRLEEVGKRAEEVWGETNKRFKETNKELIRRFEEGNRRLEDLRTEVTQRVEIYEQAVLVLFGTVILLLLFLFRSVSRHRDGRIKPLEDKLFALEQRQLHDARNLQSNITRLQNLLSALQELAKEDEKVAVVLRSFSLLP